MSDEAKRLVNALRNSYGYSSRRDNEAADMIEKLYDKLDRFIEENIRYWNFIRSMGCESCKGDCGECDGDSGWTWSGEATTDGRVD